VGSDTGRSLKVVLSGGGTGGHVYPSLALYSILRDAGIVGQALYLGMPGSAEEQILTRLRGTLDIPFAEVTSAPMAGSSRLLQLRALPRLVLGTLQAAAALLRFRPKLVIAAGGYAAAPAVFAAFLLKPLLRAKIVIEEQNLVPGLLNKAASLLADLVFVNYVETVFFLWGRRCVQAGYPVRSAYLETGSDPVESRRRLGLPADRRLVLVTGGSMGARNINRALVQALPRMAADPSLLVIHAIGLKDDDDYHAFASARADLEALFGAAVRCQGDEITVHRDNGEVLYRGFRYLNAMVDYQRVADLVVTRGGAGTLAEIGALGAAALVIPKRGLPGDHQELNAVTIATRGGCEVLFERRDLGTGADYVDPTELEHSVRTLLDDPERRASLARGAAAQFERGCHQAFRETIRTLVEGGPVTYLIEPVERPDIVRFLSEFDQVVDALDRRAARPGFRDDPYYRLYDTKVDEYRLATDFATANKGVKLIGALRRRDLYPFLAERFTGAQPFLRRNILVAFRRAEAFDECVREVVRRGLDDGYWEVRREAITLYRRFHEELQDDEGLRRRILALMRRRFERYDTRAEAIRAAPLLLDEEPLLRAMRPFLGSRRVRLRQAVLDAIEWGVIHGRLTSAQSVRATLRRMLITTSEYRAEFAIRRKLQNVLDALQRT
jgi:UDP-N-acetylglucosamine--N-acetylmuramyl-(pentapeptide) pyrophosphoryl-undecaprenol N-acetylglucosamine transferase